jgi:hypothetical protein
MNRADYITKDFSELSGGIEDNYPVISGKYSLTLLIFKLKIYNL